MSEDFFERKADQLERDLGVRHPLRALYAGLRTRSDREVTPFQSWHARRRLDELAAGPLDGMGSKHDLEMEGCIVLLMRGARIENLAVAHGYRVNLRTDESRELVADIRDHLRSLTDEGLDELIGIAQRNLDLWRRV